MPIVHDDSAKESHMRFVFSDAVVSFPLADDATFQDVALTFRDLPREELGDLVSIVVVLRSQEESSADSMAARPSSDSDRNAEAPGFSERL